MKSWMATFSHLCRLRRTRWLILIALILPLAFSIWQAREQARQTALLQQQQAGAWIKSAAEHQQSQLQQAQALLQVLSGISVARSRQAAACNAFLARQLDRFPQYVNLAFTDTQGVVWCSARPLAKILQTPTTRTLQKPYLLPVTQHELALALPQFAADGRWQGAAIAVLPLTAFFPPLDSALPAGSFFQLVNQQQQQLLLYPARPVQQKMSASDRPFWSTTLALSGSAEDLQLQLHLAPPSPAASWVWVLPLLLLLAGMVLWRVIRFRPWPAQLARLFARRQPAAPSNTQILRGAYEELKGAFQQKEARVQQLVQLDELSQRLQTCASSTEWADTVARCALAVFPTSAGALYLHVDAERYGLALAWGGSILNQTLNIQDCHALHSERTYVSHGAKASACAHAAGAEHYVCVPLQSLSSLAAPATSAIGLLFLAHMPEPSKHRTPPWAATAIAERAAIGLSTLRRHEQLQHRAIRDALTGLFNRGFMEEALEIEQQRALRQDAAIGIMLLDVDHFKSFNDRFGHAAGDILLRGIGALIQQHVREGDMPCRYGGEEFVVILPGADLACTVQRAQALCLAIERWHPDAGDQTLGQVTVSIGVAAFPDHGETWHSVMQQADGACYQAKHAGRNRVEIAAQSFADTISA